MGFVTDFLGLTDSDGEKRAAEAAQRQNDQQFSLSSKALDNASEAAKESNKVARENLKFQREKRAQWEAVYGNIQTNLGKYYLALGPEKIESLGLQKQQQEFQLLQNRIQQNLAARGLAGSNFGTYLQTTADIDNAGRRAAIRTQAPEMARKQQMGFLGLGLGQGAQMLGNINQATGIGVNSLGREAGMYTQHANTYLSRPNLYQQRFQALHQSNTAMMRQLVDSATTGVGLAMGPNPPPPPPGPVP